MAGFHLPKDPYFPDNGNGGWIKEDPEEQVEADAPAAEVDPEEGLDDNEDIDEDLVEEDFDADSKVSDPRFAIHNLHNPIPGSSFQVYCHPSGPSWMRTPRKRIHPFCRPENFLTGVPLQVYLNNNRTLGFLYTRYNPLLIH